MLHKYPRTPHLPSSPGVNSDDKIISTPGLAHLMSGVELVVTEKMDGGNVTLSPDVFHLRSTRTGKTPPWETFAKSYHSKVKHLIPHGWRVSCESLWATRSIHYENLLFPLYVIAVWDERNVCLSWDDTVTVARELHIPTVPLLCRGCSFQDAMKAWDTTVFDNESEGFVVRDAGEFPYEAFGERVAKWVRSGHIQTDGSWRGKKKNGFQNNEREREVTK